MPTATITPEVMPSEISVPSVPPAPSIQQINALHASATADATAACQLGESATRKAILLGLKLAALKEATPHGQWESLFSSGMKRVGKSNGTHVSHLIEFDRKTATRYISVAAQILSQRLSADQSAALMQLAASPQTTDLGGAEAQLLDEVVPEKSLRQLYLTMGIVKPTRREAYAMQEAEETHAPEPPPEKRPPTLAEQRQQRRDEARKFWFGTRDAGMTHQDSLLMSLLDEARNAAEAQLNHLSKQDLTEVETTLKDLLKITKHLIAEL